MRRKLDRTLFAELLIKLVERGDEPNKARLGNVPTAAEVGGQALPTCACRKLDPHVLVMQSTQERPGEYATSALGGARNRRVLVQGEVRPRLIVVFEIRPQQIVEAFPLGNGTDLSGARQ
jgi:hypothetical protein